MKLDSFAERIKKQFSRKGIGVVVIGIVAGICLLLLPSSESEKTQIESDSISTGMEYCKTLENKAEQLIEQLPEVDKCSVFITLESGYRYIYATDQRVLEGTDTKETEKTVVLAGDGNGEQPLVVEEIMPKVAGVAIVCPKATYETQYRIVELVSALFDIKSNRISVKT